ncbi:MAG: class I SAM-dependent methyltransferase [Bacteroidota bacterium]
MIAVPEARPTTHGPRPMTLRCRHCEAPLRTPVVDLGVHPPCQNVVREEDLTAPETMYPLRAMVCDACLLVQLDTDVPPAAIFSEQYAYFSSYSTSWLAHAERYVGDMVERFGLDADSLVMEIASNDGYLLQYVVERGIPALGIEPSASVAAAAREKGVDTRELFFGRDTAAALASEGLQCDLLAANNVLAHTPHLNSFVEGIRRILKPEGVATIEFPHLLRLIDENQFDTIYHEHYSYFSLLAVERVFAHFGLVLFDVEELPSHGGSLRIFARHREHTALPVTARIDDLKARERAYGLDDTSSTGAYAAFAERVKATKRSLLRFLVGANEAGKTVVGYGAPGKGNTLLNYSGIGPDLVAYTVDRNPHKQGTYLPGSRIPVFEPDRIRETRPDYVLILPWNLKREIMRQMGDIRHWGGRFVVPIPETEVVE